MIILTERMRNRTRRWLGPDGLVHETIPVVGREEATGATCCFRDTVCARFSVKKNGYVLTGAYANDVDVEDHPACVNCLGCMGGY